jgi:hypothetical protein
LPAPFGGQYVWAMKRQFVLLALGLALALAATLSYADQYPNNYESHVLAQKGDISVSFLTQKLGQDESEFRKPTYLLITHGSGFYVEPFTGPDEVTATILDTGRDPLIALSIFIFTTNQSGMRYLRLYRVLKDSIGVFSGDVPDFPGPGPRFTVIPQGQGQWSKMKVEQDTSRDTFQDLHDKTVMYLSYDSAKDAYVADNYTAGFATKTITIDGGGVVPDSDFDYFQLSDDRVNLRQSPGTNAPVVATLPRTALFDIEDRTEDAQTIGGKTARWYKVITKDTDAEGWIFGGFIRKKP